jgi:hypothetical protein
VRTSFLVVVLAVTAACGNPDRYEDHRTFTSAGEDWRVRFLDPPWELVDAEGPPILFRIASNAARVGGFDAAVLPRYELRISVEPGTPEERARRDGRRAAARDEDVLVEPREVLTRSGDRGQEVITRSRSAVDRRYFRFVYLSHPEGVLRLYFEGVPDLDEPEVDVMIEGAEILGE